MDLIHCGIRHASFTSTAHRVEITSNTPASGHHWPCCCISGLENRALVLCTSYDCLLRWFQQLQLSKHQQFITAHSWLTHGYPLAVACPHPAITFYVGNIATCGISWFFASQLVHETTLKAQKPQPSLADHPSPNASSYKRFQTSTTLSIDLAQTSSPTFSLGPLLLDCPHGSMCSMCLVQSLASCDSLQQA